MDNKEATSGDSTTPVGDSNDNSNTSKAASGAEDGKQYPAHFVDKLKKEKDNQSKNMTDLKAQLAELQGKIKKGEEDKLAETQQYKTLWEAEKQKGQETEGKFNALTVKMVTAKKMTAVRNELVKLGLNVEHQDAALKLLDITNVVIDSDTGSIVGAEESAKSFHATYSTLGFFGKKSVGVEQGAPASGVGKIDINSLTDSELHAAYTAESLK